MCPIGCNPGVTQLDVGSGGRDEDLSVRRLIGDAAQPRFQTHGCGCKRSHANSCRPSLSPIVAQWPRLALPSPSTVLCECAGSRTRGNNVSFRCCETRRRLTDREKCVWELYRSKGPRQTFQRPHLQDCGQTVLGENDVMCWEVADSCLFLFIYFISEHSQHTHRLRSLIIGRACASLCNM